MDNLVAAAMRAFVEKGETIETTLRCYFHSDPVEQLMSVSRERFFISIGLSRNPEVLTRRESAKHAGRAELEDLRKALVAKRQQYSEQLLIELEGYAVYLIETWS